MFRKDCVTRARVETFIDVGSNKSDGYEGFPHEDGIDMEIPTLYSQGLNMLPEDVMDARHGRSSDCKLGSSGSKRKWGGQNMDIVDVFRAVNGIFKLPAEGHCGMAEVSYIG